MFLNQLLTSEMAEDSISRRRQLCIKRRGIALAYVWRDRIYSAAWSGSHARSDRWFRWQAVQVLGKYRISYIKLPKPLIHPIGPSCLTSTLHLHKTKGEQNTTCKPSGIKGSTNTLYVNNVLTLPQLCKTRFVYSSICRIHLVTEHF